ncbi:MAG TPA: 16S rRNA (cytidine(1402)-2'-O)-methyltransferase [Candidatus Gastranaerophilales bacterium]|nr:16S rRNA (cytidine(1402)-2'-O)-methyltransferase [Candidatus Gastranaerophilales bacterium]
MNPKGILYICATPVGNLEDITLRALRILKEVDLIACEDTRVTQKLLNHFEIKTKLISYHKFSEKEKSSYLTELLNQGKSIALVSDAGTPLISDPGIELIKLAYENNLKIVPIPGASSVITAVSVCYTAELPFVFIGFLPKSIKDKEEILFKYSNINIIAFESPNRLVKTLEELFKLQGNRYITVARELTKIYEEIKRDFTENLIEYYTNKPPKGEIVLIIEGQREENKINTEELREKIRILSQAGYSIKELSKIISLLYGYPKNEIYESAIKSPKFNL